MQSEANVMCYEFKVGYARKNISPQDPVPLSGYGTNATRISERIMDELYTSCLAFTDAQGNTALLFSWDLQRPQEEVIAEIRQAVNAATGMPYDKILVCATHTHSTPDLYATYDPNVVAYRKLLQDRCAEAAVEALADRKAASFFVGSGDTERLNFVKHYKQANGSYVGDNFGNAKASPIVDHVSNAYGKMHVVKILREGCKDLVLANFRSHPTMTGGGQKKEVSSDFVGPYRDSMERQKNCDFVFFQGACGNINPKSRIQQENLTRDYYAYGALLAEVTIQVLDNCMTPVKAGKLQCRQIPFEGRIDHSRDHQLGQAKEVAKYWSESGYDRAGTQALCDKYDFSSAYHAFAVRNKASLAETEIVELDVVTIGNTMAFVTAPGELWDSVSVEMEARSPFPMSMTLGYANGDRKYFPHGIGCTYRSYESDYARLALETSDEIIDAWVDTLKEFYKNA